LTGLGPWRFHGARARNPDPDHVPARGIHGRDDSGQRVRAGIYLVRVQAGSTRLGTKVLRLQ
jgi:hypothetical protein